MKTFIVIVTGLFGGEPGFVIHAEIEYLNYPQCVRYADELEDALNQKAADDTVFTAECTQEGPRT